MEPLESIGKDAWWAVYEYARAHNLLDTPGFQRYKPRKHMPRIEEVVGHDGMDLDML